MHPNSGLLLCRDCSKASAGDSGDENAANMDYTERANKAKIDGASMVASLDVDEVGGVKEGNNVKINAESKPS